MVSKNRVVEIARQSTFMRRQIDVHNTDTNRYNKHHSHTCSSTITQFSETHPGIFRFRKVVILRDGVLRRGAIVSYLFLKQIAENLIVTIFLLLFKNFLFLLF